MPPSKRKYSEVEANAVKTSAVPPSLPPSVEEAYRRKCVQLKNRTTEVEDANDAARLRLTRIKRQVEKLRIERAFLLEQLAKRTSANVEDSDGSPSPPPTKQPFADDSHSQTNLLSQEADANSRKPKEKPLRIKRGHRKSAPGDPDAKDDKSPAARRSSQSPAGSERRPSADDGAASTEDDKIAKGAFELYAKAQRAEVEKSQDDDMNVDDGLEKGWKELSEEDKEKYINEYKEANPPKEMEVEAEAEAEAEADAADDDKPAEPSSKKDESVEKEDKERDTQDTKEEKTEPRDEDVEMKDDADEAEASAEKPKDD